MKVCYWIEEKVIDKCLGAVDEDVMPQIRADTFNDNRVHQAK